MKKNYFLLAASTMMFAACAQTDMVNEVVTEEAPQAIGFETFANKQTRAEINSKTDLEKEGEQFTVWAWKSQTGVDTPTQIFGDKTSTAGQIVEYTTSGWTYSPTQYWDKTGTYDFYAVAPKAGDGVIYSIDKSSKNITISGVESGPATSATDYLLDRNGVTQRSGANNTDKVEFNFEHIMSKITIIVKQQSLLNNNKFVTLTDLTMKNWNDNEGTFQQNATSEWTIDEGTGGSYTFLTDGNVNLSTQYTAGSYLMVPQNVGDLEFVISFKIGDDETFLKHEGKIENVKWETNTHYIYTISVGPKPIEFSVKTVESWGNGTDSGSTTIE